MVRNIAHNMAVVCAAAGLLASLGGCAGTPLQPVPLPGRSQPSSYGAVPFVPQTPQTHLRQPNTLETPRQTVQRPPDDRGTSTEIVARGQNAEGSWADGAGRSGFASERLRGPMPAATEGFRGSQFEPAGGSVYGGSWNSPGPTYGAAPAGYSVPNVPSAYNPVRPAQYESVPPGPGVYGGPTATPPGNGVITPSPASPDGSGAPGAAPWVDGTNPNGVTGPYADPVWPGPLVEQQPENLADMIASVQETHTGQFMFGVGVNSDAGLTGQITVNERNFDVFRPPTSWDDFLNGTAWRGGGQGFRAEAMPGTQVQRYMVSLSEPYLFNTDISFNVSGFFFDRLYYDWDEQRYGGRFSFGYRLRPDLSVSTSLRAEHVDILDPRVVGVQQLDDAVGNHDLFSGRVSITHDKRDRFFAPTSGHLLELSFEQVFGDYDYSRGEIDYRKYFLVRERPDGSGRHTVALTCNFGVSGKDTPIFENYFAGGYSTIRGFNFRGASPKVMPEGVIVGGRMRFLASAEYMFPITADDMLRMVGFCDFGTVEEDVEIRSENFRIAPGFGLRIFVPAMGPAPIALDFAFPVAKAVTDDTQVFSFFVGIGK